MGQYYKPVLLNKDNEKIDVLFTVHSWKCGSNGAKLMEHSYVNNSMVNAVLNKLKELGGARLVWAGDYANGVYEDNDGKLAWCPFEDGKTRNLYSIAAEKFPCEDTGENPAYDTSTPQICCILNHTKKVFIDVYDIPKVGGWPVHPLPILCADGNGRGGGDYHGLNMDLVGSWKGDLISVTDDHAYMVQGMFGYEKVNPVFAEKYEIIDMIHLAESVRKSALEQGVISKNEL